MRATIGFGVMALAALVAGCGSRGGNASSGNASSGAPSAPAGRAGGEDRQVLVDLKKGACTERLDLQPNIETAAAAAACTCAIDQLLAGKSSDEIMELMGKNEQDDLEDRTARECMAQQK